MTEADILQMIPDLIEHSFESLELAMEYIRNTEQFREFMEVLDNTEDVIEKLKEMLQEIAAKEPRVVLIGGTVTTGVPILSGRVVVTNMATDTKRFRWINPWLENFLLSQLR